MQSSFRGNLAFIGIPVLAASVGDAPDSVRTPLMASGVIVMALTMAFFNVLAVFVLQASRKSEGAGYRAMFAPIASWLEARAATIRGGACPRDPVRARRRSRRAVP